MDFIKQLSESQGYTEILVIMDRLTKQAIFTSTQRLINANGSVSIFVKDMFLKHRVLTYVISDRSTEFVSRFLNY